LTDYVGQIGFGHEGDAMPPQALAKIA
jgi:hypothetical protein